MPLTNDEIIWSAVRGAAGAILLALDNQIVLPPPFGGEIRSIDELEDYLDGLQFSIMVRNLMDRSYQALIEAGGRLADAHLVAAGVEVTVPSKKAVADAATGLDAIAKALAADSRFGTVLTVVGAAAEAVKQIKT
jgi:hypothetical protein